MTAADVPAWTISVCPDCGTVAPTDHASECAGAFGGWDYVVVVPASALVDLRAENERLWRNEAVLIEESKGLHNERDVWHDSANANAAISIELDAKLTEARAERDQLRDLAATMWLYVGHVGETSLTTEQKELLYDALDAIREDSAPYHRWWREDAALAVPAPKEVPDDR